MGHDDHDHTDSSSSAEKVSSHINDIGLLQMLLDQHVSEIETRIKKELKAKGLEAESLSLDTEFTDKSLQALQQELRALLARPAWGTQVSWFLGPAGENLDKLIELTSLAINEHKKFRVSGDEDYDKSVKKVQKSADYQQGMALLEGKLKLIMGMMNKGCIPFQRFSYLAHMNWDNTLPSVLGWIVGVLYNQNNIAAEASPLTTLMEIDVARQLCHMIGFANTPPMAELGKKDEYRAEHEKKAAIPWGKITCDGSVANIEAVWMARNFRYFCLACQSTLIEEPFLGAVRNHEESKVIPTGASKEKYFVDLTSWEVVNLIPERFFDFLDRIARLLSNEMAEDITSGHTLLHNMIDKRDLRTLGMVEFAQRHPVVGNGPKVVSASTRHYSWPKAVTVLGLGDNSLVSVPVGMDGRMDLSAFDKKIDEITENKVPVLLTVAVHGSTAEGAVDELDKMLEIREKYRSRGVDFLLHVDAAWGGYFASLLNTPPSAANTLPSETSGHHEMMENAHKTEDSRAHFDRDESPVSTLKPSIKPAFEALKHSDSITLDAHKSGYVPYPAGGLLLRDSRLRERIAVRAPIVFKGESDPTVSWYGLEGSRAGAAAVATWFSHMMIPLDKQGYGEVLGKCLFNSTLVYAALHYMAEQSRQDTTSDTAYFVTTIPAIDTDSEDRQYFLKRLMTDKISIIKEIIETENLDGLDHSDRKFREFVEELGSDTAIVSYIFTPAQYLNGEYKPNPDIGLSNTLNRKLYDKYSLLEYIPASDGKTKTPELFLSSTEYDEQSHGAEFVDQLKQSMQVTGDGGVAALVTTTMNPWFLDAPIKKKIKSGSPFSRGDMVSHILAILDQGVKNMIREIT